MVTCTINEFTPKSFVTQSKNKIDMYDSKKNESIDIEYTKNKLSVNIFIGNRYDDPDTTITLTKKQSEKLITFIRGLKDEKK